jgi:hypothetical protein
MPEQDVFRSQGGISPDPTGVISGSVLYVGPRPSCEYRSGRATRVIGRVILTLFAYDNPPPPEGKATTALNLYVVPGGDLFTTADCRPEGAAADPTERLTRSLPFSWSQVALGGKVEIAYQIRGFYDADEDMNPFFSVRNLPTAGDVVGAALTDVQNPSRGLLRIRLPAASSAPNGYIRRGVIVALGNYVWMERPAFQASASHRYLSAEARVSVTPKTDGSGEPNPAATLENMFESLCETTDSGCGFSLQQLEPDAAQDALAAGGVELDFDPEKYAWVSEPVDIVTVNPGAPDDARPDGLPDPHPLLGANAGVPWFTPLVIMTRTAPTAEQAAIEARAGIPNVRLIGSVLLDAAGTGPLHRVQLGDLNVAVPPVAAVELDLLDNECRVPYLAPGNYLQAFESRFTYCHDLPTGIYGISALQGVSGGARVAEPDPEVSQNGFVVDGAGPAGQAWTLPNDLAVAEQVGAGKTLASQGRAGLFMVHDPDPDGSGDCTTALDPLTLMVETVRYRGICGPEEERRLENPTGIDGQACLPQSCCDGIAHLCGVGLCPLCSGETCPGIELGGRNIRSGPTRIVRTTATGKAVPDCVPFELPALCCGG